MRVLHAYAGNLYGGVEVYLSTLARERALAPGMEPAFALCFPGRLADELRACGADVAVLGGVSFRRPWTAWRARRRFLELLRRQRPDVVVCHECWPHALFAPVAKRQGVPVVFAAHDIHTGRHWLERLAGWTRPELVLANSRVTAASLRTVFPGVRHEVVYLPVRPRPAARPRAELRRELDTPHDAVVIVQACRLEWWKGHRLLLDALARLSDLPGWVCWVAGGVQRPHEQAYLNELRQRCGEAGLTSRVRFLGKRDDVPDLLAAADVHCQPNEGPEPFGIVFVEALSAGLPVVTTAMGGVLEIVDETCGVLVGPRDAAALADAIRGLLADGERRRRLGGRGPTRAEELCGPARQLAALATALGRTAAGRGAGGRAG
jgi:glycosyltransferase involved in cell wall biosynthesis